jgi:hypothetical protein
MRLRIEPQPTPQEAEAIAAAIEMLLARSGSNGRKLRFNDDMNLYDDTYPQDYTWRDMARIEALTPGV